MTEIEHKAKSVKPQTKKKITFKLITQEEHLKRLSKKVRVLLKACNDERIAYVDEGLFIEYPIIAELFQEILDLLDQPVRPRMIGLLLYSPTNNGKTTIIVRFINKYTNKVKGNLIYVETPERTTLKEFYVETLNILGYPATTTRSTGDLRRKILDAFKRRNVSMIFFDEIHNLLDSRRDHKKDVLNGLKSLSNRAQIPIILSGIETSIDILNEDLQVGDRFFPFELPVWQYDTNFQKLLLTFECHLPLKHPSNLHEPKLAKKIWKYCTVLDGARIGRVYELLRRSTKIAIRNGIEKITPEIIDSIGKRWKRVELTVNPKEVKRKGGKN